MFQSPSPFASTSSLPDCPLLGLFPERQENEAGWVSTAQLAALLPEHGLVPMSVEALRDELATLIDEGMVECRPAGNELEWRKRDGLDRALVGAGRWMAFDEALALQAQRRLAMRQIAAMMGASSLYSLYEAADERVRRGATNDGRRQAAWLKKVAVVDRHYPLVQPSVRDGVFAMVTEALFNEQVLEFTYRVDGNPDTREVVLPLGLVEAACSLQLIARTEMKPAILGYRLDRIHAPVVLARSFEYPSDFCLSDYISHAPEYELAPSDTGVLAVRFMKPVASQLRETPIAPDQIEEINHDGSVTIRCSVVLNERLRKWLRSYGADVEVIDPPTLRQHFATTAKTAARYYARK